MHFNFVVALFKKIHTGINLVYLEAILLNNSHRLHAYISLFEKTQKHL